MAQQSRLKPLVLLVTKSLQSAQWYIAEKYFFVCVYTVVDERTYEKHLPTSAPFLFVLSAFLFLFFSEDSLSAQKKKKNRVSGGFVFRKE